MMNLAEYRNRNTRLADFLPWVALVGAGIVLNKDGSLQRTARFRGPDLDSAVPAELVAVAAASTTPSVASAPAGRSSSRRSAMAPRPIRTACSRSALRPGRCRAQGRLRGSRRAFRVELLPDIPLSAARRGCGARRDLAVRRPRPRSGVDAHEILRGFADRTDRILQLIDAFMPNARWLDDGETLTYLHSASRRSGIVSASPRRRSISTRCSPISRSPVASNPVLAMRICAYSPSSAFRPQRRPECSTS
jgi:hypothetical protein